MSSVSVVSLFREEHGFIVWCNKHNVLCETQTSTFLPRHHTLAPITIKGVASACMNKCGILVKEEDAFTIWCNICNVVYET